MGRTFCKVTRNYYRLFTFDNHVKKICNKLLKNSLESLECLFLPPPAYLDPPFINFWKLGPPLFIKNLFIFGSLEYLGPNILKLIPDELEELKSEIFNKKWNV